MTAQVNEIEFEIKKLIPNTTVKKVKIRTSEPVDNRPPRKYFGNRALLFMIVTYRRWLSS